MMPDITCPECNGYGCKDSCYLVRDSNGEEHYVRDVVTCLQCSGTGRIWLSDSEYRRYYG